MNALEALVAACEKAFAGPGTVEDDSDPDSFVGFPDDEDISSPPSGITFGMIRDARAVIGPTVPDIVAQRDDPVELRLVLPPETEEWAEDVILGKRQDGPNDFAAADAVQRTNVGLIVTRAVGGNCSALACARSWLQEVEDALSTGEVEPGNLILLAHTVRGGD